MEFNPKLANDKNADHNKAETVLYINHTMKTIKLIIFLCNFSYFVAMFWVICCKLVEDFVYDIDYRDEGVDEMYPDVFITFFNLHKKEPYEINIIVTYFAFTSLSTVGFGDYHPRSDIERIIGAAMLLLGVAVFSYIMGIFIAILE